MKFLLIPFIFCGLIAGQGFRCLFTKGGPPLSDSMASIAFSFLVAAVIFYFLARSAIKAHRRGEARISGWSITAWILAPIVAFVAGLPLGMFYVEIAHFLANKDSY
jgi:uncharacterized membrane protein YfcA